MRPLVYFCNNLLYEGAADGAGGVGGVPPLSSPHHTLRMITTLS